MIERGEDHSARISAAGIYGLVVSGSVMAAAGEHGSVWDVTISVFVTVLVYWIAESYSEVLGHHIVGGARLVVADVASLAYRRFALVEASYTPLLIVLGARAFGASTEAAIDAGLVTATALLGVFGWVAATRRGSAIAGRTGAAFSAVAFGIVMIALKTLLH
jgi:hypothetical protein